MESYIYLGLNLFTLSYPLYKSFEPRVRYVKSWPPTFAALGLWGALFIAWDVWFTQMGVWSFNHTYLVGVTVVNLPLEEWLFFVTVPFACVFIYEVLRYFKPTPPKPTPFVWLSYGLAAVLAVLAVVYRMHWYPAVTFSLLAVFQLLLAIRRPPYIGYIHMAYAITLVPFLLVNGVLTAMPVVQYSPTHTIGARVYTIPVEDFFYNMLMLQGVFWLFETFRRRG